MTSEELQELFHSNKNYCFDFYTTANILKSALLFAVVRKRVKKIPMIDKTTQFPYDTSIRIATP